MEEILSKKNFASTSLSGIRFDEILLWFNPQLVKPLYCDDIGNGCIKYHWRWPQKNVGSFLYGTGVIIYDNCRTTLGHLADEAILNKIMNYEMETIILSKIRDMAIAIKGYKRKITRTYEYVPIDDREISRNVQVIGSAEVGDTLIWDRKPGVMKLGSAWWDGLGFMPENSIVEAGKTYFMLYTTGIGQRWELTKVE